MSDCAHTALTCDNCGADASHIANRIRELEAALQCLADQDSGIPGSTARADCMATIARMALRPTAETFDERAIPPNAKPEDPVPACGHAKAGRKRDGMGFEYCGYCGFTFDRRGQP